MEPRLVLASASPRRAHTLTELGIPFRVVVSHADETQLEGEDGAFVVERLARAKATAVAAAETLPVLAADTEVVCDGRVLGKPASREAAVEMLRTLSGSSGSKYSRVDASKSVDTVSGLELTMTALQPAWRSTSAAWTAQ